MPASVKMAWVISGMQIRRKGKIYGGKRDTSEPRRRGGRVEGQRGGRIVEVKVEVEGQDGRPETDEGRFKQIQQTRPSFKLTLGQADCYEPQLLTPGKPMPAGAQSVDAEEVKQLQYLSRMQQLLTP